MAKVQYIKKRFSEASREIVEKAVQIADEYAKQGYTLTLRQMYYQFVARGWLLNNYHQYKRLGGLVVDARRAGLLDWDTITDRTRNLMSFSHWATPADIIKSAARSYNVDKWATQPRRVEVWVEKEALIGVMERVCSTVDVPYFACKGYPSDSETWAAAQRLMYWQQMGQEPIILHFGDHDPSGLDMTRDIEDRLSMFMFGCVPEVRRLALNMDQVEQYNPPPNFAKEADSRFEEYNRRFGNESWELDALEPSLLAQLVTEEVKTVVDPVKWSAAEQSQQEGQFLLKETAAHWKLFQKYLRRKMDLDPRRQAQ